MAKEEMLNIKNEQECRLFVFRSLMFHIKLTKDKNFAMECLNFPEIYKAMHKLINKDHSFIDFLKSAIDWYSQEIYEKIGREELIWWLENYLYKEIIKESYREMIRQQKEIK